MTFIRQLQDALADTTKYPPKQSTRAPELSKAAGGNGQPVAANLGSANPEAYQAYLQAEYFSGRGPSKENFGKALAYTDGAIKLDTKYAPAWALRASVENMMAESGLIDPPEGFRNARDDAERAIALDPILASAYLALAATQMLSDGRATWLCTEGIRGKRHWKTHENCTAVR